MLSLVLEELYPFRLSSYVFCFVPSKRILHIGFHLYPNIDIFYTLFVSSLSKPLQPFRTVCMHPYIQSTSCSNILGWYVSASTSSNHLFFPLEEAISQMLYFAIASICHVNSILSCIIVGIVASTLIIHIPWFISYSGTKQSWTVRFPIPL